MDVHVKQEATQLQHPSSSDVQSAGPPAEPHPPSNEGTNGMEFADVSQKDLEGGFDDETMDCN